MRQLITNDSCAAHFLAPGSRHRGQASCGSPKAQSERKIALIVKRREAGTVVVCANRMLQCGALGCAKLVSRKRGTRLCRFALKAVSELQTTRGRLRQTSPEWVIVMTSSGSCLREMDNGGLVRVLEDWDRTHNWHRYGQEHPAFDRPRREGGNRFAEKIARGRITARLANVSRCLIGIEAADHVRSRQSSTLARRLVSSDSAKISL